MKKPWDPKDIEIIPMRMSTEEYNQRLEEAAEMIYRYFCQLLQDQSEVPETKTADLCRKKRTGTDG